MLKVHEALTARQQVEMIQVFTGFETQNRYHILDSNDADFLFAYEESGFIGRQFLGKHRPLTLKVIDGDGNDLLIARRKFFWFFSNLELFSPEGAPIGRMQSRLKLIGRRFDLHDNDGQEVCHVDGPLLRPNTFRFIHNG